MSLFPTCLCFLCPHKLPLLYVCAVIVYVALAGDLDGHWWDHTTWHSSDASSMSLVRHAEPNVPPLSLSSWLFSLCLFLPLSVTLCHSMVLLIYFQFCMFFFSFCFYPMSIGDSQRGKRQTFEQSHTLSEGQKKMVRFGGHSLEEDAEWCEPQVKDSGVDTCSSTTLNEEHSHSEKVLGLL